MQRLLSELPEVRPTYVIFYDLSRVAREEADAFWLLGQIRANGSRLMSTREPVDDSPQGLLLFAIMAGSTPSAPATMEPRSRRDWSASTPTVARSARRGSATATPAPPSRVERSP